MSVPNELLVAQLPYVITLTVGATKVYWQEMFTMID